MEKKQVIVRMLMALAIAFGVQTTASAQFGKLLKKAKEKITENVETPATTVESATTSPIASVTPSVNDPIAKVAFIGGSATPERQKVYDYYLLPTLEQQRNDATNAYSNSANDMLNLLNQLYKDQFSADSKTYYLNQCETIAKRINSAFEYDQEPAEMADLFDAELMRVKTEFLQKFAPSEQISETDQKAWLQKRQDDRMVAKFGLNMLKDNGQNGQLKRDFEAKVKADLKPTKMLGTYIVSAFWQGLYLVNKPEFAQYSSVQELRAKAYYIKDGKYYYVKGAKRHGILKSDASGKSVDFPDYNPGLETPIEIPASLAKKYFK